MGGLVGLEDYFGEVAGGVVADAEKVGFVEDFGVAAVRKIGFNNGNEFSHFIEGGLFFGETVLFGAAFAVGEIFKVYDKIFHGAKIVYYAVI